MPVSAAMTLRVRRMRRVMANFSLVLCWNRQCLWGAFPTSAQGIAHADTWGRFGSATYKIPILHPQATATSVPQFSATLRRLTSHLWYRETLDDRHALSMP